MKRDSHWKAAKGGAEFTEEGHFTEVGLPGQPGAHKEDRSQWVQGCCGHGEKGTPRLHNTAPAAPVREALRHTCLSLS